MPEARYPHIALTAQLTGTTFGHGKPPYWSGQLSAKTSRQLAYHTKVGSGMCRRGTNHFGISWCRACRLHRRPPHWHAYSRLEHANAKGACYMWFGSSVWLAPSSFAWKPFDPRTESVKGYCNCNCITNFLLNHACVAKIG
jgi:hypothetical protein